MPEDVETSFLNQTIKMFTKVGISMRCIPDFIKDVCFLELITVFCCLQISPASVKNKSLYTILKAVLTPILHELSDRAVEVHADP